MKLYLDSVVLVDFLYGDVGEIERNKAISEEK
jgi:hypothetical protein